MVDDKKISSFEYILTKNTVFDQDFEKTTFKLLLLLHSLTILLESLHKATSRGFKNLSGAYF